MSCRRRMYVNSTSMLVMIGDLKDLASAKVRDDRPFTIDDLQEVFCKCRDLPCTALSQFNSYTETVPYGFKECSQMNTSRRSKRNSCRLVKRTGCWLPWRGNRQACASPGQMPEPERGLPRKIKIGCMDIVFFWFWQDDSLFISKPRVFVLETGA
jgi:hypothetical protein